MGVNLDKPIIQNLEIFQILLNKVNTNLCSVDLYLVCHILHFCSVIQKCFDGIIDLIHEIENISDADQWSSSAGSEAISSGSILFSEKQKRILFSRTRIV